MLTPEDYHFLHDLRDVYRKHDRSPMLVSADLHDRLFRAIQDQDGCMSRDAESLELTRAIRFRGLEVQTGG